MPNLCLHEIIDAYGEPDYLLSPEAYKAIGVVNLIWESHGFTYEVETHSPGVPITADVCGGRVIEFSVGTPYQKIRSIYLTAGFDTAVIPWTGYGSYGSK
jgi:hypothetical protein